MVDWVISFFQSINQPSPPPTPPSPPQKAGFSIFFGPVFLVLRLCTIYSQNAQWWQTVFRLVNKPWVGEMISVWVKWSVFGRRMCTMYPWNVQWWHTVSEPWTRCESMKWSVFSRLAVVKTWLLTFNVGFGVTIGDPDLSSLVVFLAVWSFKLDLIVTFMDKIRHIMFSTVLAIGIVLLREIMDAIPVSTKT